MRITCVGYERINEARDGLDLRFSFVDDKGRLYRFHSVAKLGAQISWYMTKEGVDEYSRKVFPLVVNFINDWWNRFGQLPPENEEYYEGRELGHVRSSKLDWEKYTINLDVVNSD
jgi:hypothetical protein